MYVLRMYSRGQAGPAPPIHTYSPPRLPVRTDRARDRLPVSQTHAGLRSEESRGCMHSVCIRGARPALRREYAHIAPHASLYHFHSCDPFDCFTPIPFILTLSLLPATKKGPPKRILLLLLLLLLISIKKGIEMMLYCRCDVYHVVYCLQSNRPVAWLN